MNERIIPGADIVPSDTRQVSILGECGHEGFNLHSARDRPPSVAIVRVNGLAGAGVFDPGETTAGREIQVDAKVLRFLSHCRADLDDHAIRRAIRVATGVPEGRCVSGPTPATLAQIAAAVTPSTPYP